MTLLPLLLRFDSVSLIICNTGILIASSSLYVSGRLDVRNKQSQQLVAASEFRSPVRWQSGGFGLVRGDALWSCLIRRARALIEQKNVKS